MGTSAARSLVLTIGVLFLMAGAALAADGQQVAQLEDTYYSQELWDASGKTPTGPAATPDTSDIAPDSVPGWNRFWFDVNDRLYYYLFKPVAQGYGYVIPEKPRTWVNNFFHNLLFPMRFVNCLLQGQFRAAGVETSRFIGNTAFGFGGLSRFAYDLKPTQPTPSGERDLGQTFGVWGMGNGTYLVWPLIGPSTVRDSFGYAGDYFMRPTTYLNPWYWSMGATAYEKLNNLSLRIGEYETLTESAIDPYTAVRDAYLRYRAQKVKE